jgi:hypothetical protein
MTTHRSALALILTAALAAMSIAPAAASPLNGRFQAGIQTNTLAAAAAAAEDDTGVCGDIKGRLDYAEKEADKHAGTQAAGKWSKLAGSWWADGKSLGCGWAA